MARTRQPCEFAQAVRWVRDESLPECFRDVAVAYQWSASAGVKPWDRLHLHIWVWFDRPACDVSLRRWLRPNPVVDAALANPVQPHYTAVPLFKGAIDPLKGQRSGFLEGSDEVTLPAEVADIATYQDRRDRKVRTHREMRERDQRLERLRSPYDQFRRGCAYVRAVLAQATRRVRDAEIGDRHSTLVREACGVYAFVLGGQLDEAQAVDALHAAARIVLPAHRHSEIDEVLRWAKLHAEPRRWP